MVWQIIPESFKKRICRFLLLHSLNPYIKGELALDQLSLDLYNGVCTICDLSLDVDNINKILLEANIPIVLLEGKIQSVTMCIPWANIVNKNSVFDIKGINVILKPTDTKTTSANDFANSINNSLHSMTVSMELAKECLQKDFCSETEKMSEGLETFSHHISELFSRCKIFLKDVNITIQQDIKSGSFELGLQLCFPKIEFFDEIIMDNESAEENNESFNPKDIMIKGCKHIRLHGVQIFFIHPNNFDFKQEEFQDTLESLSNLCDVNIKLEENKPDNIQIAQLLGTQEVKIRYDSSKSEENLTLDIEAFLGDLLFVIFPKQLHLLIAFVKSLSSNDTTCHNTGSFSNDPINRKISTSDYNRLQENFLHQLYTPASENEVTCFDSKLNFDESADQFYSLSISNSTQLPTRRDSLPRSRSVSLGSENSMMSSQNSLNTNNLDVNSNSTGIPKMSISLQLKINQFVASLFHSDFVEEKSLTKNTCNTSSDSLQAFNQQYFSNAALLMTQVYYSNPTSANYQLHTNLAQFCKNFNHLSFGLSKFHCELKSRTLNDVQSSSIGLSIHHVQVVECLNKKHCYNCLNDSNKTDDVYFYTKLFETQNKDLTNNQNIKIKSSLTRKQNKSQVSIYANISPFISNIDPSIVDRLSILLTPQNLISDSFEETSEQKADNEDTLNQILCENDFKKVIKVKIVSPEACFQIGIPLPDLKQERHLFTKELRDEYFEITLKDFSVATNLSATSDTSSEVLVEISDMVISYADKKDQPATSFIHISQQSDNCTELKNKVCVCIKLNPCISGVLELPQSKDVDSEEYSTSSDDQLGNEIKSNSPFSSNKCFYGDKKVELPGTQKENELFIESNRGCSRVMLDLSIPNINLMIPSKDFLESLYNRICYDVLLWQSRASKDENLNEETSSDSKVPLKLDLESQIFYKNHTESNNSKQTPKFYSLAKDSDESDEEDQATTIFNNNQLATNAIALNLSIDEGRLSIFSSLNHQQSKDYRRIDLFLRNAVIFYVSAFHDDPLLDYMCCRLQSFSIHHQSSSSIPDHVIEKDEVAMVTPILCADDQSSSSKDVYHHNITRITLNQTTLNKLLNFTR